MIGGQDAFCGSCGARQGAGGGAAPAWTLPDFGHGMPPQRAALLCYIPWIGWIGSLIVLASSRFHADKVTRFHAFQGLYLFVAWLLVELALEPMFRHAHFPFLPFGSLAGTLQLALIGASVFMLIKVAHNEMFRLPFIGDLADKSVAEQR